MNVSVVITQIKRPVTVYVRSRQRTTNMDVSTHIKKDDKICFQSHPEREREEREEREERDLERESDRETETERDRGRLRLKSNPRSPSPPPPTHPRTKKTEIQDTSDSQTHKSNLVSPVRGPLPCLDWKNPTSTPIRRTSSLVGVKYQ
jgi:hypothetical protein